MRKVEFAEFLQDEIREEIPELENAQMWLRYIEKDNDRSYYGLTIKKQGMDISPTFNMDAMYKEYTRPLEQQIDTDKNIFSVLDERANRTPNDSLVEYKNEHGEWSSFSATEFRAKVIAIAKGLIAQGIMPGESVSIISHTCWQWTALDVAIMSIGALTVPVYETNSPAQVKMIFNDANVKMAFAEDDAQRDKIESIRNECSNLGDVYVIGLGAIDTMIEYGHAVSDAEFQEREHAVKGSDLATIVYTSGSTGTPKGIELTHSNFVFITYSGISSMPDIAMKPNRRLLLFLPLAHVFARYMQFFCFAGNVSLGLSSNLKTILADFKAFKPTFILAVPRIFEKIYNAASQKAGAGLKGRIFAGATQTARDWSYAQQSGEGIPVVLNLKHALYNKLVYSSIMDVFGGHVEYAVSGGAPLDSSIAHFFNGVGLPLLEGYGMTETCFGGGVQCMARNGYHLRELDLFLEILDPVSGEPVPDGETGEIVLTTLNREAMPLIRYRTGGCRILAARPLSLRKSPATSFSAQRPLHPHRRHAGAASCP